MVKRRRSTKRRTTRVSHKGYNKKCVLSVIRRAKIGTAKQFSMAIKKARKACKGSKTKVSHRRVSHRRAGSRRRKGAKMRKCKYGHRKGSKRCRKTARRARR